MEWTAKNFDFVLQLSVTHLLISLLPLFLGSVFAFALVRLTPPKLAGTIGTTFSAIYAIPSLAIFVALPAVIGTSYLGPTNVVIALSVYVAASMFFSTRDAFNQVPQPTVFIARAQGLSPFSTVCSRGVTPGNPGSNRRTESGGGQHRVHGIYRCNSRS